MIIIIIIIVIIKSFFLHHPILHLLGDLEHCRKDVIILILTEICVCGLLPRVKAGRGHPDPEIRGGGLQK